MQCINPDKICKFKQLVKRRIRTNNYNEEVEYYTCNSIDKHSSCVMKKHDTVDDFFGDKE